MPCSANSGDRRLGASSSRLTTTNLPIPSYHRPVTGRLLLFAAITCATLLVSFYLWRPLLGDHVLGPPYPDPPRLPTLTAHVYVTPTPAFDFDRVPLADGLDRHRRATGKNIFVNWRALEASGINMDHPVTLHTP